ncbi:hypothetical protein LCGC14_2263290 [marine sediment metagenome]|uniref:Calcineurin-like phosphoesterase domain-containing protein n=1 Tax=marine sediment metagenome TaxID=412755 RepID=A0A0F9CZ23_9ZZZZ
MSNEDIKTLDDIKNETEANVEIMALRGQISGLKIEIKTMQTDYGNLRGYFRDLDAVAVSLKIPETPKIYNPTKDEIKVKTPCVAVLHWSDWHYGAIQEPDEIEFMNSFSPDILKARIENLCDDFVRWVSCLREGYVINECVILDTGDNISGDIHRELSITNAFPTPVQAFECGVLKGAMLSKLAPHFESVRMEFIVPDNHSRLTDKPQSKQAGLNSHNYVVGHVGRLVASNQTNIEFNIHTSNTKVINIIGRRYLLSHGHDIKAWMGVPYYGIERKVSREALVRLNGPDDNKFHKVVMGHFHAPLAHPYFWIGGSASGTDEFDHKCGRRSIPMQSAWIVHKEHGEFNRTDFILREK